MSDLFHKETPDDYLDHVFAVMALAGQHTFQVLTKRADRLPLYLGADHRAAYVEGRAKRIARERGTPVPVGKYLPWPLPNVWIGVSVEDQERADERIPHLLRTPASVRFLSCEPLLGPVDLTRVEGGDWEMFDALAGVRYFKTNTIEPGQPRLDWVIIGGESGTGARSMHISWARRLADQCQAARVATFVKQYGSRPRVDFYDDNRDEYEARGHDWTPVGWSELDGQPQPGALVELRLPKKGGDLAAVPGDWPREFPEVRG
jgi:protein gp37